MAFFSFIHYLFFSYPWGICDFELLLIQINIFQAVSHFANLIQLCIFMIFTTISLQLPVVVFFALWIISTSFWVFVASPNYICGINFCICYSPFQITHANAKLNVTCSQIPPHSQINTYPELMYLWHFWLENSDPNFSSTLPWKINHYVAFICIFLQD